jgi:hypothetical protein
MAAKVPPEILHLLEKRELAERRKKSQGKSDGAQAADTSEKQERRRKTRRQPAKGNRKK